MVYFTTMEFIWKGLNISLYELANNWSIDMFVTGKLTTLLNNYLMNNIRVIVTGKNIKQDKYSPSLKIQGVLKISKVKRFKCTLF